MSSGPYFGSNLDPVRDDSNDVVTDNSTGITVDGGCAGSVENDDSTKKKNYTELSGVDGNDKDSHGNTPPHADGNHNQQVIRSDTGMGDAGNGCITSPSYEDRRLLDYNNSNHGDDKPFPDYGLAVETRGDFIPVPVFSDDVDRVKVKEDGDDDNGDGNDGAAVDYSIFNADSPNINQPNYTNPDNSKAKTSCHFCKGHCKYPQFHASGVKEKCRRDHRAAEGDTFYTDDVTPSLLFWFFSCCHGGDSRPDGDHQCCNFDVCFCRHGHHGCDCGECSHCECEDCGGCDFDCGGCDFDCGGCDFDCGGCDCDGCDCDCDD